MQTFQGRRKELKVPILFLHSPIYGCEKWVDLEISKIVKDLWKKCNTDLHECNQSNNFIGKKIQDIADVPFHFPMNLVQKNYIVWFLVSKIKPIEPPAPATKKIEQNAFSVLMKASLFV